MQRSLRMRINHKICFGGISEIEKITIMIAKLPNCANILGTKNECIIYIVCKKFPYKNGQDSLFIQYIKVLHYTLNIIQNFFPYVTIKQGEPSK